MARRYRSCKWVRTADEQNPQTASCGSQERPAYPRATRVVELTRSEYSLLLLASSLLAQ